jgi:hypothetical protein
VDSWNQIWGSDNETDTILWPGAGGISLTPGPCRNLSNIRCMDSVTQCTDGSYVVTGPHGHVWQFGEPNAGFERFPGEPPRPVYERQD